MTARIGFVGLGVMGSPMVLNLVEAPELDVAVFDQSARALEALRSHPAWGRNLNAVAALDELADCGTVITMLPNSPITSAVMGGTPGQRGLIDILGRGATVVDMGSSQPAETRALAERLQANGIHLLDAPVSGAVVKARSGQLAIMVGGEAEVIAGVEPLLKRMGSTLIRTGRVGSAHAMKALNNYVYAAGLLATSEAVMIAESMDLDLDVFAEVLNASSGRNVATETKLRQFILPRTFNAGFAMRLQAKDLATADGLQALARVDAPQLSLCNALWKDACAALAPDADNTALLTFLEHRRPETVAP